MLQDEIGRGKKRKSRAQSERARMLGICRNAFMPDEKPFPNSCERTRGGRH